MTTDEFETLSTDAKKKWLTEFNFRKEKHEIETYNDYTGLEFLVEEYIDTLAQGGDEMLMAELIESQNSDSFDYIESTMEIDT
jgi:hypothetical protein